MENKSVVVVGASAVGSLAAKYAAGAGLQVTLLEEDEKPGKFGKCGAIFSKDGLDSTGVNYRPILLNEVKGARILSRKKEMLVKANSVKGVVLSRQQFDERCADEAVAAGADLKLGHGVLDYSTANQLTALTKRGSFSTNFLMAADGVGSLAAKKLGFPAFRQSDLVMSYQAEFENASVFDRQLVDVLLDTSAYKNFFAWTIPVNEERVRVGVATTDMKNINQAKDAVFTHPAIAEQVGKAKKTFDFYYTIPLRYRKQTQKRFGDSYAVLLGDAAGQVKATTGGGVIFGSKCARVAAEEAHGFLSGAKTSVNYEHRWRKEHGRVLDLHYAVHRAYRLLNNDLVDLAVSLGNIIGLPSLLGSRGDMDYIFR